MNLDFACATCGNCCRNHKLPLTVAEAIAWLADGNDVQILCEAEPWPDEPLAEDQQAAYRRERSFAARSASLATRVTVILAAPFPGACPNLQSDMRCAIYQRRPLVCRSYPAEINPFIELQPARKACPAEAWAPTQPPFMREGILVDARTRELIRQARAAAVAGVGTKERLCAALHLDAAALVNEGFVVYSPDRANLLAALEQAETATARLLPSAAWRFVSNRRKTVSVLSAAGAFSSLIGDIDAPPFEYVGFYSPSLE